MSNHAVAGVSSVPNPWPPTFAARTAASGFRLRSSLGSVSAAVSRPIARGRGPEPTRHPGAPIAWSAPVSESFPSPSPSPIRSCTLASTSPMRISCPQMRAPRSSQSLSAQLPLVPPSVGGKTRAPSPPPSPSRGTQTLSFCKEVKPTWLAGQPLVRRAGPLQSPTLQSRCAPPASPPVFSRAADAPTAAATAATSSAATVPLPSPSPITAASHASSPPSQAPDLLAHLAGQPTAQPTPSASYPLSVEERHDSTVRRLSFSDALLASIDNNPEKGANTSAQPASSFATATASLSGAEVETRVRSETDQSTGGMSSSSEFSGITSPSRGSSSRWNLGHAAGTHSLPLSVPLPRLSLPLPFFDNSSTANSRLSPTSSQRLTPSVPAPAPSVVAGVVTTPTTVIASTAVGTAAVASPPVASATAVANGVATEQLMKDCLPQDAELLRVVLASTVVRELSQTLATVLATATGSEEQELAVKHPAAAMQRAIQCVLELEVLVEKSKQQCISEKEVVHQQLQALLYMI